MPRRTPSSTPLRSPVVVLLRRALIAGPLAVACIVPACSSDDSTPTDAGPTEAGMCLPDSGATTAAEPDMHCIGDDGGAIIREATSCPTTAVDSDAGMEPLPGGHEGTEAYDDDCKYHVKYFVTCVAVGQPVTFTVTLTSRADGSPVTGANPKTLEGFLGNTHLLPNDPTPVATELGNGVYTIGPVVFDQSGKWTVRFHFFETCNDVEGSKHGHAAFFVDVP